MKNSSWKNPFPTFNDNMFDKNKDGKLDAFETAFRDAHIEEMKRKAAKRDIRPKGDSTIPLNPCQKTVRNATKTHEREDDADTSFIGVRVVVMLVVVAVLAGGLVLAFSTKGTAFIKAIILFVAGAAAIGLLRMAGICK